MSKPKGKWRMESNEENGSSSCKPKKDKMVPDETFIDKLMKKGDSLTETFEFDLAKQFYKRVLDCEAEHVLAIESLASVHLQLGELDQSEKYLLQALRLQPERGHGKYFAMGQLKNGRESLSYYEKGIEILNRQQTLPEESTSPLEGSGEGKKRDLSLAYCSMAEMYMTDLCDEDDAESQCEAYIKNAISADGTNPESYMCAASFHLVKENIEDAKTSLEKSLSLWLPEFRLSREQGTENCSLSYDARLNTSKMLIELSMFDEANEVLDGLVEEDDEVVHVWYMMGLLNFLRGSDYYGNARYYFNKALKLCKKFDLETENEEQIKHIQDMMNEMGPGSDDEDEDKENHNDNDDDDEYETVSEEEMES